MSESPRSNEERPTSEPPPPEDGKRAQPGRARPRERASSFFWIALALPHIGYVGSIGLAEAKRWGAPTITIPIEGYDPRDPFRGQYLRYRVSVQDVRPASTDRFGPRDFQHACAAAPQAGVSSVFVYDRARPAACTRDLPVEFVRGDHRYYVQQDQARGLEDAVRDGRAAVRVHLISPEKAAVGQLLIDGKPW